MVWAEDTGKSEGRAVMARIGVELLLYAKASPLPAGRSGRKRLENL